MKQLSYVFAVGAALLFAPIQASAGNDTVSVRCTLNEEGFTPNVTVPLESFSSGLKWGHGTIGTLGGKNVKFNIVMLKHKKELHVCSTSVSVMGNGEITSGGITLYDNLESQSQACRKAPTVKRNSEFAVVGSYAADIPSQVTIDASCIISEFKL